MRIRKNNKGFSLVELIIVIAIMAILSAVIGLAIIRYIAKARKAHDIAAADALGASVSAALSADDDMNKFIEWNVAELIKGNGKNTDNYRVLGYSSVATGNTGNKYNVLFKSNNIGASHAEAKAAAVDFANFMNNDMGDRLVSMKFNQFSKIDQWIICIDRLGNISVWVGAGFNGNQWTIDGNTHMAKNHSGKMVHYYMLWPEVDKAYERLNRPSDAD